MGGVCGARGGVIGVFNDDQKSAINKLKETITIDDETCYLFLVECSGKNLNVRQTTLWTMQEDRH